MDDLIGWLLNNVPSPFRGWILAVANTLKAFADRITSIFFGVANAIAHSAMFINGFIAWLYKFGVSTVKVMRWVIVVKIPGLIRYAIDAGYSLMITEIGRLRSLVRGWVDIAQHLANQLVSAVWAWLGPVWRWIQDTIAFITATLLWVRDHVVQLLTNPAVLAEWLVGAMVSAIGRYLIRNDRRIAIVAWRILLPSVMFAAREAETIITDIF